MLNIEFKLTAVTGNSKIILDDVDNLLLSTSGGEYLEVDTIGELIDKLNEIHQHLFGCNLLNDTNVLETKGVLLKDHPLYKTPAVLDAVGAENLTNGFDIEVVISFKDETGDCEFNNDDDLARYIKEELFTNAIDGFYDHGGCHSLETLTKYELLPDFVEFVGNDETFSSEQTIEILSCALEVVGKYAKEIEKRSA